MTDNTSANAVDVLVAGAGPVGLTLAHELVRRGVRVRVVDARPGPATTSRAIATHPRTLEIYHQMGIVDKALPLGQRITAFTLFQRGRRLTRLEADYRKMPTRFPFTLTISQVSTEKVLRDALTGLGVTVEWGVRLGDFEHDGDGVRARLDHADGTVEWTDVPWLAGCDGGHSLVRKKLGLRLAGESSETWMLADTQVETDLPRNSIYWVRTEGVTMMMVPLVEPGRWRLLDTADAEHDSEPVRVAERFGRMISAGIGAKFRVSVPDWVSVFTFQQRMISRMRVGRCLVAGDAAHVHSPASGQGMNTGIQEAYNLAWKLAMVVHGQAEEALLDTYTEERVPVGADLLRSTKTATRLIQLKNPVADRILPVFFAVVRNVAAVRRRMQGKILGNMSGLGVNYATAALSLGADDPGEGPRPGERVSRVTADDARSAACRELLTELRDPRWTLLAFVGGSTRAAGLRELAESAGDWLSVRAVLTARPGETSSDDLPHPLNDDGSLQRILGADAGTWLLVRPDGYLCARGRDLTDEAFRECLGRLPLAVTPAPAPAN
jgi:6-methylpretetramide 4-monooxygenase / 4-hydroxy-6-methylpretetramide 12a-monooxygenase